MIASVNPATEICLKHYDVFNAAQIEEALSLADRSFQFLNQLSFAQRAERLLKVADILAGEKERFATLMTREMGKTFSSAIAEVEKCVTVCHYYAEHGEEFMADKHAQIPNKKAYVRYQPLGAILAVMPWNFPFWQVFRFAVPALMAGNVALLKHASNVPQCAVAIEEVFSRGGFSQGCFQTLLISADQVESLIQDSRVKAVTLTGSEGAGRSVAAQCGQNIKKVVLELGGSDPFIIMPSANIDAAVDAAVTGRTMNNGQSCIAAKRLIIHDDIYDEVRSKLVARFESLVVGDPMDHETDIGPLATQSIRDELASLVDDTVKAGAKRVTGAKIIDGKGYYYQPGLLEDVPDDSPAAQEELFGPVACLFRVESLDDAIRLANNTRFGLGSAIFTEDEQETERAISDLVAGAVFVNSIVASDPRLPFGGVKASGIGRELAAEGMHEFVNIKTVSIA
jgi:succinate-semialdehyde dehydrogenase/glutarate-semialdehyde dehydrogenase